MSNWFDSQNHCLRLIETKNMSIFLGRHVVLTTTFSVSRPITNLNCVFISYMPQRLFVLVANYNKNVLLGKCNQKWLPQSGYFVFSTVNLLNSHALRESVQKSQNMTTNVCQMTFLAQFTTTDAILKHFVMKTLKLLSWL